MSSANALPSIGSIYVELVGQAKILAWRLRAQNPTKEVSETADRC